MTIIPEALKDCVSDKVRKLMDEENYPEDQAVAIAISMCEGKHVVTNAGLAALRSLNPEQPKDHKSAASAIPTSIAEQLSDEEQSIWQRTYDKVFALCNDALKATLAAMGAVNRARSGLAVKSRKADDGSVIVEGWAILFADEDHRDLDKTWFGPNTQYLLDFYKGAPLWLSHGEDPLFRSNPIGYRVSQMVYPEHGIWLGHKLDPMLPIFEEEPDLFEEVVGKIEAGMLGYSTDSIFHHVYEGFNPTNGELTIWPMAGTSLVEAQAEPALGPAVIRHIQELKTA